MVFLKLYFPIINISVEALVLQPAKFSTNYCVHYTQNICISLCSHSALIAFKRSKFLHKNLHGYLISNFIYFFNIFLIPHLKQSALQDVQRLANYYFPLSQLLSIWLDIKILYWNWHTFHIEWAV